MDFLGGQIRGVGSGPLRSRPPRLPPQVSLVPREEGRDAVGGAVTRCCVAGLKVAMARACADEDADVNVNRIVKPAGDHDHEAEAVVSEEEDPRPRPVP